ncbi:MAG: response regulator [Bdellovibrio sp.]|nr:response regulator [Bdellovibrio sp.]
MTSGRLNKIILIADDCELNRDILEIYFGGEPYKVLLAENGQQALDIVIKQTPDLILMDMQMPVMNGFEATKAIRSYEKKQDRSPVVIISVSGLESDSEKEEIFQAGCTDLIVKPIRKNILFEKINKYLNTKTATA